jgi:RNase P/RNase MRP subunit p29
MVFLAAIARFVCTSWSVVAATLVLSAGLTGQVIDFESNGLHYQALTRDSVTVTFAKLPSHIAAYNVFQVTITNGSPVSWVVKPEDFTFFRQDGSAIRATPADVVIASLLAHASKGDVVKLQLLYESSIYAMPPNFRSTAGYEHRREQAMTVMVSAKIKAAVAASAVTLVSTKLKTGGSTDGAVFFQNREKVLGPGRLVVNTAGEVFQFDVFQDVNLKSK